MVKFYATLPEIPREVVYKALINLNLRKKWDVILKNLAIIDGDPTDGECTYYY